jgi:hypothetical protein
MYQIILKPALLLLLLFVIVITVRIFSRFPSRIYRERFANTVRYLLVAGLILGLVLPWNPIVGIVSALIMGFVLLILSLYTLIVMGRITHVRFLREAWIRREVIRDWFVYLSIITGVIGIVLTMLSIILPPFLDLTLDSEVPLVFDTLSVTAAFLELTIPSTSYRKIYGLVYRFLREEKEMDRSGGYTINDSEFLEGVKGTEFTEYEVRDALESFVELGMAKKMAVHKEAAHLEFTINIDGLELMRLYYEETMMRLNKSLDVLNEGIERLDIEMRKPIEEQQRKNMLRNIDFLEREVSSMYRENKCFNESGQCIMHMQKLRMLREQLKEAA